MKDNHFDCRICGHGTDNPESYRVRETRLGLGDVFEYVRCPQCGCVQISEIPEDLGKYYPSQYYSLQQRHEDKDNRSYRVFLRKHIINYRLTKRDLIGKWFVKMQPNSFEWVEPGLFSKSSSILDIGCGTGRLIIKLAKAGFVNVTGIEPFIDEDIHYEIDHHDIVVHKKEVKDMAGKFDVVILNHVVEHLTNPVEDLKNITRLMNENSRLVIALPLLSNFMWEQYGVESLPFADAPRHLHIFTYSGFCQFASSVGLSLLGSKPYIYEGALQDVYGNYSDSIMKTDKTVLMRKLLSDNDTGLMYLYFRLKR
jgi:SAM-dependent methyltransferase